MITAHGIDLLIITLPWRYYDQIAQLTTIASKHEVDVRLVPAPADLAPPRLSDRAGDGGLCAEGVERGFRAD